MPPRDPFQDFDFDAPQYYTDPADYLKNFTYPERWEDLGSDAEDIGQLLLHDAGVLAELPPRMVYNVATGMWELVAERLPGAIEAGTRPDLFDEVPTGLLDEAAFDQYQRYGYEPGLSEDDAGALFEGVGTLAGAGGFTKVPAGGQTLRSGVGRPEAGLRPPETARSATTTPESVPPVAETVPGRSVVERQPAPDYSMPQDLSLGNNFMFANSSKGAGLVPATGAAARQFDQDLIQRAVDRYGITNDANQAGYLLPDGRFLNFRRDDESNFLEHDSVGDVLDGYEPDGAIGEFMYQTGAIRVNSPTAYEIGRHDPTPQQVRSLVRGYRNYSPPSYAGPEKLYVERSDWYPGHPDPDNSYHNFRDFEPREATVDSLNQFLNTPKSGSTYRTDDGGYGDLRTLEPDDLSDTVDDVTLGANRSRGAGVVPGLSLVDRQHPANRLPMDEASRNARRQQMGYDLPAWHGTTSPYDFSEFLTGHIPRQDDFDNPYFHEDRMRGPEYAITGSGDPNAYIGPHAATDPQTASSFTQETGPAWYARNNRVHVDPNEAEAGPRVYPLYMNNQNVRDFYSEVELADYIYSQDVSDDLGRMFEEVGFDDWQLGSWMQTQLNGYKPDVYRDLRDQGFDTEDIFDQMYAEDPFFRRQANAAAGSTITYRSGANPEVVDQVGRMFGDAARSALEAEGVTTVRYPNAVEGGTGLIAVVPPRSVHAAFDPERASDPNILAANRSRGAGLVPAVDAAADRSVNIGARHAPLDLDADLGSIADYMSLMSPEERRQFARAAHLSRKDDPVYGPGTGKIEPWESIRSRLPVERVPYNNILTDSDYMRPSKINKYQANQARDGSMQTLPVMWELGGRYYIRDGRHRTIAAIRNGSDTIPAHVEHLPNPDDTLGANRSRGAGLVPGLSVVDRQHPANAPIRAWHGSPYTFDKFERRDRTGEGSEAFGRGLYFAENRDVGENYRQSLAGQHPGYRRARDVLTENYGNQDAALESLNQQINKIIESNGRFDATLPKSVIKPWIDELNSAAELVRDPSRMEALKRGSLYEVDIHADPDKLLNWFDPYSGQSDFVQEQINNLLSPDQGALDYWRNNVMDDWAENGPAGYSQDRLRDVMEEAIKYGGYGPRFDFGVWDELAEAAPTAGPEFQQLLRQQGTTVHPNDTGETIYSLLRDRTTPGVVGADASKLLLDRGVQGVRFPDQISRWSDDPKTNNYTIFDPSIVDIRNRYREGGGVHA